MSQFMLLRVAKSCSAGYLITVVRYALLSYIDVGGSNSYDLVCSLLVVNSFLLKKVLCFAGAHDPHMNLPSLVCGSPNIAIEASKIGNTFSPARTSSRWTRTSRSSSLQSPESLGVDNSLALVPVQTNENDSGSLESGPGWQFLRGLYTKRNSWTKVSAKKAVLQWVSRLRGRHSAAVIYLDRKRSDSGCDEDCSSSIDGEDVVSISRSGSELMQSPLSHCVGSNNIPEELEGLHEKYSSTCRLFTYEELLSITSNFASGMSISIS